MLYPKYFHNKSYITGFASCYWWAKNNFSGKFKLKSIITYHI